MLLSADTLRFDTVFTTAGSVTQLFKITNGNNQKLKIDQVSLQGGTASSFKINVDGVAGPAVKNIELDANDSIFVFVEVTIDPNNPNTLFIVKDSILFSLNGNMQQVYLEAFGQRAHFHHGNPLLVLRDNEIWTNDLPHVVYGVCCRRF